MLALLMAVVQAPAPPADSAIIAAVRAAAEREPVEAMADLRPTVTVKDVRLLDVDGDGKPEAFVWIEPGARQSPTILVYTYDPRQGAHRLLEALVPGRLEPVTGRLVDDHTLGFGVDMSVDDNGKPVDYDRIVSIAADNGMSLVRYATFMHADKRNGFVDYVDLSDRDLPTPGTKTCADFEFSPVEAIAVGRVPGKGATQYLVALTKDDVTLYHFRGIRPDGRLVKETTIQARADDVIGLATTPDGVVQLVRGAKRPSPAAPATGVVVERDTALGILHITDPAGGLSKRAATDSIISGQIADAARDYRQYAPVPRGAFYDLAWPKDTAEYRRMAGFGLILITAVDQQAAELPIARAYVETANGRDSTLTLLGSIASEIPAADSSARTVFGRYRFDALYLVPLAPGWRGSVVIIDFTQGRTGFRVGRIAETTPAEVAGATTRLAARPEAAAVAVMIRREYPDFIVTK